MKKLVAIVLAAGKGTRMKSTQPKVLHELAGRPMLFYPLNASKEAGVKKTVAVVGYGKNEVIEKCRPYLAAFAVQKEQLGTAHAVACGLKALSSEDDKADLLILSGDAPLITSNTLKAFYGLHRKNKACVSLLTAVMDNPRGYGRILRDTGNEVEAIIEEKDANAIEKNIREVNSGIYLISLGFIRKNIRKLDSKNAQNEYYLPDIVRLARQTGKKVGALTHLSAEEVMGINNRAELANAGAIMQRRICRELMIDGVTMEDPESAYIDHGVVIGRESIIGPSVRLKGKTVIGENCLIGQGSVITDASIESGAEIRPYCVIEACKIARGAVIGPFARLRPGSSVEKDASVGNFVEVKNSSIGRGTKANHLSYIGDSVVGAGANIGAGVITCNYDGFKKHSTRIEDGAFIGSDSQLVAPVKVGKGAYVGSGTTVTKDVPPGSLVTARTKERVIKGWVKKRGSGKK